MFYVIIFAGCAVLLVVAGLIQQSRNRRKLDAEGADGPTAAQRRNRKHERAHRGPTGAADAEARDRSAALAVGGAKVLDFLQHRQRECAMSVVLVVLGALCVAALSALFMWVRRSAQRDIDYTELMSHSTQSEAQRRFEQMGIGLSASPNHGF